MATHKTSVPVEWIISHMLRYQHDTQINIRNDYVYFKIMQSSQFFSPIPIHKTNNVLSDLDNFIGSLNLSYT